MFVPSIPEVSLEQWRALLAVVDAGGYAQAAQALHKSQSSITYAVKKLESLLGVEAFQLSGRKAVLTSTGQLLVRRARALVEEAAELERAARRISSGWEAEIRVAVEIIFPSSLLLRALAALARESAHTRVEVFETALGGTAEVIERGQVELAITPRVPAGMLGEPLARMRGLPVANPEHPLHKLGRPLGIKDLRKHRHLLVRDGASQRDSKTTTVDVAQRWTFSTLSLSIDAACAGHGFAWYPEERIRPQLASGLLKPLPMREAAERWTEMYLVFVDREGAGPGTLRLAELLRAEAKRTCPPD
ncbi:MAG TPA: LysR family transcriptional regulator [Polyangiales bacterium]